MMHLFQPQRRNTGGGDGSGPGSGNDRSQLVFRSDHQPAIATTQPFRSSLHTAKVF